MAGQRLRSLMVSSRGPGSCLKRPSSSLGRAAASQDELSVDPLFSYTSGRWLFNESLRLSQRYLPFEKEALLAVIAKSAGRRPEAIESFKKFAEGGLNRIFQATFTDGYQVLARLPYPLTQPKCLAVASEAATLGFLNFHNIPVSKVLAYSTSADNAVGAEYILLEKIEGRSLDTTWYKLDNKTRLRVMKQVVALERKLFDLRFPASGSIYYKADLDAADAKRSCAIDNHFETPYVIGPITRFSWWYKQRAKLLVDRGPWRDFLAAFEAPARRELEWCREYGKDQLPEERGIREVTNFQMASTRTHENLLNDYLHLAQYLDLPADSALARPVLRHPDLTPSNIIISEDNNIVGLIDWQHAVVLPLSLTGGIPQSFQNYGDPASEMLLRPETELPANFDQKTAEEQEEIKESHRRRAVHFLYAAYSKTMNPDNWQAFRDHAAVARARMYDRSAAPWEGNSIPLKAAIINILKEPALLKQDSLPPSVKYTDDEMDKCLTLEERIDDRRQELSMMQDTLGIDSYGFCRDDEHLTFVKGMIENFRAGILAECTTDTERRQLTDHWPFVDHDED